MEKNKEALMQYVEEIKNLRSLILNDLAATAGGPGQSLVTDTSGDKNNNNTTPNDAVTAQNRTQGAAGAGQPGHQGNQQTSQQITSGNTAGASQQVGLLSNNKENILRKALKCKQLEDDNKKLRKLLKTQIENSEQLRQDTHNTIETLREEFDILVRELLQYK